ncbi:uncharacterized protein LOC123560468 [Mercenaria mercenaria]|uniref:uncharacterized protein LOC123560468 n=1 Tax=Mercenaria mercenaria TaxID=6596 RepID=UPI00234EEDA8|nr:uncharacterized protein LOC123560468 [Mercenaria mercenaria]
MMRHVTMKFPAILLFLTLILRKAECSEDKRLLLHDAESIAAIIHQLETRIDELNSTHSKDVADLKAAHAKDVAELKAAHVKDVAELKAAHAKEVADLKAGLNAEKLEHCKYTICMFQNLMRYINLFAKSQAQINNRQ